MYHVLSFDNHFSFFFLFLVHYIIYLFFFKTDDLNLMCFYLLGSKAKSKPKREKSEEEKTFRRRAKYFLVTQVVGVLVFLSLLGVRGGGDNEVDLDDEEDDYNY